MIFLGELHKKSGEYRNITHSRLKGLVKQILTLRNYHNDLYYSKFIEYLTVFNSKVSERQAAKTL